MLKITDTFIYISLVIKHFWDIFKYDNITCEAGHPYPLFSHLPYLLSSDHTTGLDTLWTPLCSHSTESPPEVRHTRRPRILAPEESTPEPTLPPDYESRHKTPIASWNESQFPGWWVAVCCKLWRLIGPGPPSVPDGFWVHDQKSQVLIPTKCICKFIIFVKSMDLMSMYTSHSSNQKYL